MTTGKRLKEQEHVFLQRNPCFGETLEQVQL